MGYNIGCGRWKLIRTSNRVVILLLAGCVCFGLARAAQQTALADIETNPTSADEAAAPPFASSSPGATPNSTFASQPVVVATLQAQDTVEDNPPESTPKFSLRGFTPDASQVLIAKKEIGKPVDEYSRELVTTYELVSLTDGATKPLSKIQADADFVFVSLPFKVATSSMSAPAKTDGPEPWFTFLPSLNTPPPKDVVRSFTPEEVKGCMVYAASVALSGTGNNTKWGTFVVLRRFGKGVNPVQTFPVNTRDSDVFLPQWSPNGSRILFNVGGQGDSTDTYLIHVWNIQTGRIEQGPKERVSYLNPRWSPDSTRIAYIVGGDIAGQNGFLAREPTSLRVYDVLTGKSHVLKTALSGPEVGLAHFQWENANSLLYDSYVLPTPVNKAKKDAVGKSVVTTSTPQNIRPAIFQVASVGGVSRLIVRDGFRPMPSPDGRWVAFFGWPDAKAALAEAQANPQSRSYGPRLFLWERQTKRRFLVRPNIFSPNIQMKWTPDSHKLVLLQSSYDSKKFQGLASISTINVGSG